LDDELWRPFEGRYHDGFPLIGAVRRQGRDRTEHITYPWCIHLTVHFDAADERGYPTAAEETSVGQFSDALLARLRRAGGVIEAALLTGHGAREFWWYVSEPEPMHRLLAAAADEPHLFRAFDYDISLDHDRSALDRFGPG